MNIKHIMSERCKTKYSAWLHLYRVKKRRQNESSLCGDACLGEKTVNQCKKAIALKVSKVLSPYGKEVMSRRTHLGTF